jgi:hypothetical protein
MRGRRKGEEREQKEKQKRIFSVFIFHPNSHEGGVE